MKKSSNDFGKIIKVAGFSVKGDVCPAICGKLVDEIVDKMGMQTIPGRIMYSYPFYDGSGGKGFTLIQPITESFIAIDQWEDFSGAYVFVVSCVIFDIETLLSIIKSYGLIILDKKEFELSLENG
jgi:hypothetical protein